MDGVPRRHSLAPMGTEAPRNARYLASYKNDAAPSTPHVAHRPSSLQNSLRKMQPQAFQPPHSHRTPIQSSGALLQQGERVTNNAPTDMDLGLNPCADSPARPCINPVPAPFTKELKGPPFALMVVPPPASKQHEIVQGTVKPQSIRQPQASKQPRRAIKTDKITEPSSQLAVDSVQSTLKRRRYTSTKLLTTLARNKNSEEHDGTYKDTPEEETPRLAIKGGHASSAQRRTRPRHAAAEGHHPNDTPAPTKPARGTLTINSFACTIDPLTGNPVASVHGLYSVSPQLHGIRKALGDTSWATYMHLIEQLVDGSIDEEELDREERRLFQCSIASGRTNIRGKMLNMVTAVKSTQDTIVLD
ncbi:hypothetical protein BU23DRAFT_254859 [Bimuria novae-zelandiae CBS 107.79]|uniref:Uncharacterized protein n=1 Tax=Bimuria novae-zelandiae CBS 107.79 TaxID=1447943 RepID=A0A6A5UVP6_9PLEO|nr:hypothetical protein BU23DRAFT_254859 [Bimuria novae-zelandiae CBS 107.79]